MRKVSRQLGLWALLACGTAGCMADVGSGENGATQSDDSELADAPHAVHLMRVSNVSKQANIKPAATAHLTYYGGPVISNVKIVSVFWNANVTDQSSLNGFYSAVTNSAYFDWLSEYNTPTQSIGRGTLAQSVTDTGAPTSSNISDAQIQSEINRLINAGSVVTPDANTLYMVHFPPGVNISAPDGSKSCQVFCAYHGTYTRNGQYVYYGVIPDMGGNCASGCGSSSKINNTTSVASHEMIEAVTDAAVGLAQSLGPPLAWYDDTSGNGEIGDICNGQQGTIAGYTVQKEWSNSANACIVSKAVSNDFSLSLSPSSETLAAGASTTVKVSTAVTAGSVGSIALSVTGLPAGVTGTFNPTSVTAGNSSTLTLTAASTAASATASLSIVGTASGATHSASNQLTVSGGSSGTDTTPPVISLVSPANGSTIASGNDTIVFDATDNVGVSDVVMNWTFNGKTVSCKSPVSPWKCTKSGTRYSFSATIGTGTRSFSAKAVDAAGNATTTPTYSIKLN